MYNALDPMQPIFDCPDLMERRGTVLITSWHWKPRESVMFGLLFSRFLPLHTDLTQLQNGAVQITGVSPDLPRSVVPGLYTCQFRFCDGRHWFDGFVPLGVSKPLHI